MNDAEDRVVHIRRLRVAVMLCGVHEFEAGKPKACGTHNPAQATCDGCVEAHRRRVAALAVSIEGRAPGTYRIP